MNYIFTKEAIEDSGIDLCLEKILILSKEKFSERIKNAKEKGLSIIISIDIRGLNEIDNF